MIAGGATFFDVLFGISFRAPRVTTQEARDLIAPRLTTDLESETKFQTYFQQELPIADQCAFMTHLRQYQFYFLPGIFDGFISQVLGSYYGDQIQWLRSHGVAAQLLKIRTEDSVANNSVKIADHLRQSDKPVIFVTHSKTGLDVLSTLTQFPDVRSKVGGWIALQSPFFGTMLADRVRKIPHLYWGGKILFRLLGGNHQAVDDMTTERCRDFMTQNREAIREITRTIPTLCVASYTNANTILRCTRNFMRAHGLPNDGLVPTASALLPGSRYLTMRDHDHAALVTPRFTRGCDRTKFFHSALNLLLTPSKGTPHELLH